MRAERKGFGPRRTIALLLALLAGYAFLNCTMLVIEEFPKRSLDSHAGHWWSHFIVAFGMVFVLGSLALWAALRLWRQRASEMNEPKTR